MTSMYTKSFDDADEVKAPPKAHVSVVKLGDMNASKMIPNLLEVVRVYQANRWRRQLSGWPCRRHHSRPAYVCS